MYRNNRFIQGEQLEIQPSQIM